MMENVESIDSKFRFILIAAKRARQLQGGAKPLIHTNSRKAMRVAQEEVRAGVIGFELVPYVKREDQKREDQKKQDAASRKAHAVEKAG